jgi:hypothetical protein
LTPYPTGISRHIPCTGKDEDTRESEPPIIQLRTNAAQRFFTFADARHALGDIALPLKDRNIRISLAPI